jgi:hypothetical protein
MRMLERIERAALVSVSRACGFAAITIFTFMVGMSGSPALCFKAGGLMVLLTTAVLILKAVTVRAQPYKSTEVWLMLAREDRPSAETAQQLISGVLREIYLEYARHTAGLAAAMLAITLVMQMMGVRTTLG